MRILLTLLLAAPLFGQADQLEANYQAAKADLEKDPKNADKLIWVGRRLGYLGRFEEAIATYTQGIALHPGDARLYRHRGHRYISLRRFALAVKDLRTAAQLQRGKADEIEPDGQPNKLNQPLSTLQFNIYYHLGLAHYLAGDFEKARAAYEECMERSRANDDSLVATSDWLYMTLRRLKRDAAAAQVLVPIHEKMTIIENASYWNRLLMYKGLKKPEGILSVTGADDVTIATQGYGVGNWYLYNGKLAEARRIFEQVVAGKQKSAFGYIAAEAELKRMQ
jgi:tetratricopeptide (TPR) repeat protein